MYIADIGKTYAMVIGVVLLLVGLIGFVNNPVLGIFGVNTLQNVLHVIGGALGVWFGMKGSAKAYNRWLGIIAGVIGVLGFVPGASDALASVFGINAAISGLHIVIAVVSLGIVYGLKK
jgi:hypothetical protein